MRAVKSIRCFFCQGIEEKPHPQFLVSSQRLFPRYKNDFHHWMSAAVMADLLLFHSFHNLFQRFLKPKVSSQKVSSFKRELSLNAIWTRSEDQRMKTTAWLFHEWVVSKLVSKLVARWILQWSFYFFYSNVLLSQTICSYCSYFMSKLTDRPSFFLFIYIHIYPSQNLNPQSKSSGINISTVGALLFMNNLPKSLFSEQFHGCCSVITCLCCVCPGC